MAKIEKALLLTPDEERLRELRHQIEDVQREISSKERFKLQKQSEISDLEARLVRLGGMTNGTHRQDIIRASESLTVLRTESAALDGMIANLRAERAALDAELLALENRERDCAEAAQHEANVKEIAELIVEHGQRMAIATFAAKRMGEIVKRLRDLSRGSATMQDNAALKHLCLQNHNRAQAFAEQTNFQNVAFLARIQEGLANGWR